MTKTTTYQCDLCKLNGLDESKVIGVQTQRADGKRYEATPSSCDRRVCKKCLDAIEARFR